MKRRPASRDEMHVIGTAALLAALPEPPTTLLERLEAMLRTRPLTSMEEVIEALWGNDPSGGPNHAPNAVFRKIWALRRRGLPVRNHNGRGFFLEAA